jgi:FkbM family methyltransferase
MTTLKRRLSRIRRQFFELMGLDYFSHPANFDIDKKLGVHLPYKNGFFIEGGANNGLYQSNTYYFAKFCNWKGILIEGIPELYQECLLERPEARVFNNALVSHDFPDAFVTMKYANLMSLVSGLSQKTPEEEEAHIKKGIGWEIWRGEDAATYEIQVPCRTLTSILDECSVKEIDLFSLDVEGAELSVLQGLDFNKYRPKFMLIETYQKDKIDHYISPHYQQVDQLSIHDYLYQSRETLNLL